MLSGFADRLSAELARNVNHVSVVDLFLPPSCRANYRVNRRSKYTHPATRPNASTVGGWEEAYSPVSARSINCGSAKRSGM